MNEYEFIIEPKILAAGLRQSESVLVNDLSLLELYNLECSDGGLIPFEPIPNTIVDTTWPFNFAVEGNSVLGKAVIYHFILDALGGLTVKDEAGIIIYSTLGPVQNLMSNLPFVADFGKFLVMGGGECGMIYGDVGSGFIRQPIDISGVYFPSANCGCHYNGRLVLVGITSPWPGPDYECTQSYAVWSRIGDMDCRPGNNESGYSLLENCGLLMRCLPLDSGVVCYGGAGICKLVLAHVAPMATFGRQYIQDIGLPTKGAVAGDRKRHVGISTHGKLFEVTDEGFKWIGYQTVLRVLNLNMTVVSYDKYRDRFFISDPDNTFVFSRYGLSQVYQRVKCTFGLSGETGALVGTDGETNLILRTGVFDMNQRGMKSVGFIETDLDGGDVDLCFRREGGNLESVGTVPLNSFGAAYCKRTAQEFSIRLFRDTYENGYITYIKARYKFDDQRFIRGQIGVR